MPEGPPKFIQSLRNCKVAEGTAARFECKIRGNPEPEVEWTREGKVLRESKQLTFLYDDEDNCKLIITKGTTADVGEYKVTAWNHHGRATSTARLIIDNGLDDDSTASESELSDPELDDQVIDIRTSKFTKFYTVKEELGKGRFGVVFRCINNKTGKAQAAKIIKCAKEQDKEEVKHEIEIMNTIRPHKRLLTLTDAFATETEMVIVTELVTGGELFEKVVEDEYIDESEVSSYMKQILEGVKHMHERDVLHLDLKPENIMLVRPDSKQIKLIDFGLARKYIPGNDLKIMFGTPEFVAPEVLTYDTITRATDLWSVGVIAYVLLSGLSPFMGDTDAETLINVQLAEWDFDDPVFEECSQSIRDFISSLLVLEPEDRATVNECLEQDWLLMKKGKGKKIKTDRLKAFTARRKWKKAMSAIRSTNFLKRLLGSRGSVGDASKPEEGGGGGGGGLLARVKAMHAAGVQAPTGGTPPTSSGFLCPSSAAAPFAGLMAGQAIKEEHFPPKKDLTNEVIVEEKVPTAKGWGRLANKASEPQKTPKRDAKLDKKAPEPKLKSEPKNDKKDQKISLNKPGQLTSPAPEPKADGIMKAVKPEATVDKKAQKPKPKPDPKIVHDKKDEKISSYKPEELLNNTAKPEEDSSKKAPKPEPKVVKKCSEPKSESKNVHDKKNGKISSNKPGQLANKSTEPNPDSIKLSRKSEPNDEKPSQIKNDENANKTGRTQSQQTMGENTNKAGKKDDKKLDHKNDKATNKDKSGNESTSKTKSSELKNNVKTSNAVPEPNHEQTKPDVKPESKKLESRNKKEEQCPKPKDLNGKTDPSTNGPESRNGPVKIEKVPQTTEKEDKVPETKPQEDKKEVPAANSAARDDKKGKKGLVSKVGQPKKTPNKLGDKIGKFNQVKSAAPTFGLDYTKRNKPADNKPPFARQQGAAPMMEFGMSYNKKPVSKENAATTAKVEQKTSNAAERNCDKAGPVSASEGKTAADETKTATNKRRRRRKRRVQG